MNQIVIDSMCIFFVVVGLRSRCYTSESAQPGDDGSKNVSSLNNPSEQSTSVPPSSRFVYPEFLPDPNPKFRHPIREKLERRDLLNRRYVISFHHKHSIEYHLQTIESNSILDLFPDCM